MKDVVDIYLETGDFHESVKRSGLPIHIAHLKLLKSGVLKIQDKIQYGSRGAKLPYFQDFQVKDEDLEMILDSYADLLEESIHE